MAQLLTDFNTQWTEYNGATVKIDGLAYKLTVRDSIQRYPYDAHLLSVYATPVNKSSKRYKAIGAQLGDDWSTDVLASDPAVVTSIMRQVCWRF